MLAKRQNTAQKTRIKNQDRHTIHRNNSYLKPKSGNWETRIILAMETFIVTVEI